MIKPLFAGLFAAMILLGASTLVRAGGALLEGGHDYPEAASYDVSDDAEADVDAALALAGENGTRVMLVMGANWCHDSRALAGWLGTERFAGLIEREYELVFVNVGRPQSGDGHNLEIARRFGLEDLPGTPNLLVLTADGELVNGDTATTWRDAASREKDAIYEELERLAEVEAPLSSRASQPLAQVWVGGTLEACEFAASEEGPWVNEIAELGEVSALTELAGMSKDAPFRCTAKAIVTLQKAGSNAGYISNPVAE
ncbi:MAG: thioredoxin family protein [Pseudomonadota bacterium]